MYTQIKFKRNGIPVEYKNKYNLTLKLTSFMGFNAIKLLLHKIVKNEFGNYDEHEKPYWYNLRGIEYVFTELMEFYQVNPGEVPFTKEPWGQCFYHEDEELTFQRYVNFILLAFQPNGYLFRVYHIIIF
jgi:hypothetical protein